MDPHVPIARPTIAPRDLTPEQLDAFWAATQTAVLAVIRRPVPPGDRAVMERARIARERHALEEVLADAESVASARPKKRL